MICGHVDSADCWLAPTKIPPNIKSFEWKWMRISQLGFFFLSPSTRWNEWNSLKVKERKSKKKEDKIKKNGVNYDLSGSAAGGGGGGGIGEGGGRTTHPHNLNNNFKMKVTTTDTWIDTGNVKEATGCSDKLNNNNNSNNNNSNNNANNKLPRCQRSSDVR